ncbi:MAG: UDP-N-acetylmuramate dehydrogenase [Patescibacteria group bacterium]
MIEIKKNEILASHSTFKIGGPARYFAIAKNKDEIIEAIDFAKNKNLPYFIFGGGSNILFSDRGFNGVVIKIQNSKFKIQNDNPKFKIIKVDAGTPFIRVIMNSVEAGLSGLEWGIGIPGTIGGCVAGNCGAYGHSISEVVEKIKTLDKEYSNKECNFEYRTSRFKPLPMSDLDENKVRPLPEIILEIGLKLKRGDKEKLKKEIKDILDKRKTRIPPFPSVGSIFKNLKEKNISAGSLIERCGLKGRIIGGAQISEQHANFIINIGGATAEDVLSLIKICKDEVKKKFNVDLEEEIIVV